MAREIKEILEMLNRMVLSGVENFKLAAVIASRLETMMQTLQQQPKGEDNSGEKI